MTEIKADTHRQLDIELNIVYVYDCYWVTFLRANIVTVEIDNLYNTTLPALLGTTLTSWDLPVRNYWNHLHIGIYRKKVFYTKKGG